MADGKPKLLDQLRQQIRVRNYSIRIEAVYAEWAKRYLRFQFYRHAAELGSASAGHARALTGLRSVAHHFYIVSVRVKDERAIVIGVVMLANARSAIVAATC